MVFALMSRFPEGLAKRIQDWLQDDERQRSTLNWSGISTVAWNAEACVGSFLMDDLLLRLRDTKIPRLSRMEPGFLAFIGELSLLERSWT